MNQVSIIIPVFNEEIALLPVLVELKNKVDSLNLKYEIIVIDDGSTDQTGNILQKIEGIKLINHPYNKGYGASLKTGARNAKFDWLLFFDGDGQHRPEYIAEFMRQADQYDMIVGARQGYQGPLWRQPGKMLIHLIADYLAGKKIPDLNCGFRLLKKEYFFRYEHLFPDGFSLSTTSTLAFLRAGLTVKYIPITINKRVGQSALKTTDGFRAIMLVVRLIMLFSPLKIFIPIAFGGFAISAAMIFYYLITTNFETISKSGGYIFIAALLVFLFGLLADQIAAIRRELKR
jgi:glycosyltransferase involved in cell wall biosynthesis